MAEAEKISREDLKSLIQTTVKDTLADSLKSFREASTPEPPTSQGEVKEGLAGHKDYSEALDCPDCYPKIKGLIPKLRKKLEVERKDKGLECVGCGLGMDESEESCSWCGSGKARRR